MVNMLKIVDVSLIKTVFIFLPTNIFTKEKLKLLGQQHFGITNKFLNVISLLAHCSLVFLLI